MIKNDSVIYITSHGVCFLIRLISLFLWALQGIFALRVTESVSNDFTLTRLKKDTILSYISSIIELMYDKIVSF